MGCVTQSFSAKFSGRREVCSLSILSGALELRRGLRSFRVPWVGVAELAGALDSKSIIILGSDRLIAALLTLFQWPGLLYRIALESHLIAKTANDAAMMSSRIPAHTLPEFGHLRLPEPWLSFIVTSMENCFKSYFVYSTVAALAACQTPPASNQGTLPNKPAAPIGQSAGPSSQYDVDSFGPPRPASLDKPLIDPRIFR